MDTLKSKEGLAEEVKTLRSKLQSSREQNSVLSDQLLLLQKECKNLLNSISGYEETSHKLTSQVARLSEKNNRLKKKLKQAVSACSDIKKQAENYISSIQKRFSEQVSRMTGKTEELDSFCQSTSLFKYENTLSVSERENESSLARLETEDIIQAYTQEIKEKQIEISTLTKSLETKSLDLDNIRLALKSQKEAFEKKLTEKDKIIENLQKETRILHERTKAQNLQSIRTEVSLNEEDHLNQIEALQHKISSQSKKFENFIRTIANLEKQAQLQLVKISEQENLILSLNQLVSVSESEKKDLQAKYELAQSRNSELEDLKIQQAKTVNGPSLNSLKRNLENLEDDNKKLLEANHYIQNYAEGLKKSKDAEIAALKAEISKCQESSPQKLRESNPYLEVTLFLIQSVGESDPEKLKEKLSKILQVNKEDPEAIRQDLVSKFKEFSNRVLSALSRLASSIQKTSQKLEKVLKIIKKTEPKKLHFSCNPKPETGRASLLIKQDDLVEEEDLEVKLAQSASKIKELNDELSLLKDITDQKDDFINDLELKNDRLRVDKEKRQKENNDLHMKIGELETEIRLKKDLHEASEKKKTSQISSLEQKLSLMKKELDQQKNLNLSEKEELFDHIIRLEQEGKTQTLIYKTQLEDLKSRQKNSESIIESIENFLGSDFTGDHLESIKKITSSKRRNSFSFKLFRKSSNRSESGSKNGTPTGSEVMSPTASGASVDYAKLHRLLEQEKMHNLLHLQQIEALRENIRHLEYENSKKSDSKIYQNLRVITLEVLKKLPILNESVERKIQIMMALLWLTNDEKQEIELSRRLTINTRY